MDKEIKSSLDFISSQEKIRKTWMDKAMKMTNPATMKTAMMTAKFAAEAAESRAKVLNVKQVELAQLMGKKPKKLTVVRDIRREPTVICDIWSETYFEPRYLE